jgi:hypothetical protein
MKPKELEILPCWLCNKLPTFSPWPSDEFPSTFYNTCGCNGHYIHPISAGHTLIDESITKRRASLNNYIRSWNARVKSALNKCSANSALVTCRYCKRADLVWGKRPYKSAWNGRKLDYVLYERVELPDSTGISLINGTTINKIKRIIIHNCLGRKYIVSVKHEEYER